MEQIKHKIEYDGSLDRKPGRPAGERKVSRQYMITVSNEDKLVQRSEKTGESRSQIVNKALAKYFAAGVLAIVLLVSCKKEVPECYQCQWVRFGKMTNEISEQCGPDVQSWAMTVRVNQPEYYPVCSRK